MFGFSAGASAKEEKKPAPSGDNAGKKSAPPPPKKPANPITDYATGGATRRRMEALGLKDGGVVRGPGTGISDDIKTQVPEGSYIMPADSTAQIGPEQLAAMGKQVPVNLSNGEYQLPPEQVHAVGVQALEQMKNATHTPAEDQAKGFTPQGGKGEKPEMFFADGGAVRQFGDSVGGYWSRDNAQFEAGSPSTMQRVGRAINPVTSFGSAIGAMRDAAGQGDVAGMGLAAAQAIPVFGAVRAVAPTLKTAAGFVPSAGKTAAATAGSAAFGAAADQYAPSEQSFADGGVVEDPRKQKQTSFDITNTPQARPGYDPNPWVRNAQAAADAAAQRQGMPGEVEDPRRQRYAERVARYEAGKTRANTLDPALPDYTNPSIRNAQASADAAAQRQGMPQASLGFDVGSAMMAVPNAQMAGLKTLAGGFALPFAAGIDLAREGAVKMIDGDPGSLDGGTSKYADAAINTMRQGAGELGDTLAGFKAGARNLLGVQQAKPMPQAAPAVTPKQQAEQQPVQSGTAAAEQAATSGQPGQQGGGDLPVPQTTAFDQSGNNVTRVGNSFSGGTVRQGFTVNGQSFQPSGISTPRSAQNEAAVKAMFDRTAEFGAGAGFQPGATSPRVTVVPDSSRENAMRNRLVKAASTPYAGAQNGQLTANQIRTLADLQKSDDRNAVDVATNSENNAARLAETAMREQGQNARTERTAALDERRIAGEEEERGFSTRAQQRIERLYEQYDKAKPEDRAAIAEQIRVLNGKDQPARYAVAQGGQEIDPVTGQLVTRPAMVFNQQTGEFVQQQGAPSQAPRAGEVRGGYRFKGGNPADQNNWEKI